jgi:hypothetical protein
MGADFSPPVPIGESNLFAAENGLETQVVILTRHADFSESAETC